MEVRGLMNARRSLSALHFADKAGSRDGSSPKRHSTERASAMTDGRAHAPSDSVDRVRCDLLIERAA
jgi:hypothetical protein